MILIDGSNFYHKLKDLGLQTLAFDYAAFSLLLSGNRQMAQRTYYVGEVRTDGTAHAQKLYNTAYENLCERIYLVSSDTDLIPAIQKAQAKGKIVEYVGFSHQVSLAMTRVCKETKTFTRDDLLPFIPPQLLTRKRTA